MARAARPRPLAIARAIAIALVATAALAASAAAALGEGEGEAAVVIDDVVARRGALPRADADADAALATGRRALRARVGAAPIAKPDFSVYHTTERLFEEVARIVARNPRTMRSHTLEREQGGYSVAFPVLTIVPGGAAADFVAQGDGAGEGAGTAEATLSAGAGEDAAARVRILLNYGEHGRELITSETCLRLLQHLEALGGDSVASPADVPASLRGVAFVVVPLENVNGRARVESGKLCERKNGRGVDTNRNFEVDWGVKEKDYDPAEEYPGTAPLSEPEAYILNELASVFKPHAWINVHSGMEAMFLPWDHALEVTDASAGVAMPPVLAELNRRHCKSKCVVGSGGSSVGYLAHGTASDHMFKLNGVPFSSTWEIYGDLRAHNNDCFRMFNPVEKAEAEDFAERWAQMVISLAELFPREWARLVREQGDSAEAMALAKAVARGLPPAGAAGGKAAAGASAQKGSGSSKAVQPAHIHIAGNAGSSHASSLSGQARARPSPALHPRKAVVGPAQRSHGVTSDSDFLAHLDADAARVRAAVAGGYNGAVAEFGEEHVLVGVFVAIVAGVLSSVCCVVVCLTGRVPVPFLSRRRMRGARRGRAR